MFSVIFLLCLLHYTSGFFVPCPLQRLTKLYETPNSPASSSSSITKVDALEATETKTIAAEDEEGLRDEEEEEAGIVKGFKRVFNALQEGDSLKQAVADGIAITGGDYNYEEELEKALEISKSKPIVMFIWNNSPACKKAIKYLRIAGVNQKKVRYVELDDDWTEGNRLRAVLGRHIGRTSVPMIFFKGKYIGGCEDGVDDNEAPGLVPLAMKGVLHAKLESIGAFRN